MHFCGPCLFLQRKAVQNVVMYSSQELFILFSRIFILKSGVDAPKTSNFKDGIERELMDNFLLWQCRWMFEEHSEIFSKCN